MDGKGEAADPQFFQQRIEYEDRAQPDRREKIARPDQRRQTEEQAGQEIKRGGRGWSFSGDTFAFRGGGGRDALKNQALHKIRGDEYAWQHGGEGQRIAGPAHPELAGQDIVAPVSDNQVIAFEQEPDEDREREHAPQLLPPAGEQRTAAE